MTSADWIEVITGGGIIILAIISLIDEYRRYRYDKKIRKEMEER